MSTHALYRFFDDQDRLLYIGITIDPGARWKTHSKEQPWWFEVTTVTLEKYQSRGSVLRAERAAIIDEHPRYNIVYNRGNQGAERPFDLIERMTDWPNWGSQGDDMPDICHDECRISSGMYFPYIWERGLGYYQCERGHQWWCKWGHKKSGSAPENAGKNQDPANTHEVTHGLG